MSDFSALYQNAPLPGTLLKLWRTANDIRPYAATVRNSNPVARHFLESAAVYQAGMKTQLSALQIQDSPLAAHYTAMKKAAQAPSHAYHPEDSVQTGGSDAPLLNAELDVLRTDKSGNAVRNLENMLTAARRLIRNDPKLSL